MFVTINETKQWIRIINQKDDAPVLLVVDGGFYRPEMHRLLYSALLDIPGVTVVLWDQRGLGKSHSAVVNWDHISIENYADDLIFLVRYLLDHFNQDKLYLLSHCFGTIPGLMAVHKAPQYFRAYFSVSQVVNPIENFSRSKNMVLDDLLDQGDQTMMNRLNRYEKHKSKSANIKMENSIAHCAQKMDPAFQSITPLRILVKIWSISSGPLQIWNYRNGSRKRRLHLHKDYMNIKFAETVHRLSVPVYFLAGRQDKMAVPSLIEAFFRKLEAPHKTFIWFEKSGHYPFLQEPEKFTDVVRKGMNITEKPPKKKKTSVWSRVMSLC